MKATTISIIIGAAIIAGAILLIQSDGKAPVAGTADNVAVVEGKQIIEISAKGGYQPRKSAATAGVPTVVRFTTRGTFDCSSFVRIPSLGVSKMLPQTGSTDIDIGTPQPGTLKGSCGMGMYQFEIAFQ
jgi:uncharacterized protein